MRTIRSEIFEEYIKIAKEKGLYPKETEGGNGKDTPELKKYRDEAYARVGSDDISTIEALYGVKPDGDHEYEHNIMEAAHPKPVVISPAYDRINGLVENEIEGQNIRINLVMSPSAGKYVTQGPKLAHQNLVMELVRLANHFDNTDQEEFRMLTDNCLEQLADKKKSPLTV